jgi:glutamine amidotransferase
MLRRLGIRSDLIEKPSKKIEGNKYILPGVGSFDSGIKNLIKSGWHSFLKEKLYEGNISLLGICLGMQLLFSKSEEGSMEGLGFIKGSVKKFNIFKNSQNNLKIPIIGWKEIFFLKKDKLFEGLENNSKFYFVHSYYCEPENINAIIATANHGVNFSSIVKLNNIYGVQFHPEKSHKYGMKLLNNFSKLMIV